ncbi:MAG TPA: phosphoribosylaminoimidazolecarboxamide formyltransferase [Clostridiales bacterium]|nr:phosphoribosylaminoimidazolecarboxamide formyltransferase [Clostridiales bacterium]
MFKLKYGCNPHQKPATLYCEDQEIPLTILNGNPGYINFMDALNAWQLVKELKQSLGLPAAASFKHVSPAGAALGLPLSESMKKAYHIDPDTELSPVACAYARARGADRVASYGDFAAFSDEVDESAAKLLEHEVSDGIIAPSYSAKALEILKSKRKGSYNIIQVDSTYVPVQMEKKQIFGITFEQKRNDYITGKKDLTNIVTQNKDLPESAMRDMILALITLKYTQSNSVCYVYDGQVIGNGAGQQARIHCTRLAGDKADFWLLRQHPAVLNLQFKAGLKKADKDNAIDTYLRDHITEEENKYWETMFEEVPQRLSYEEKQDWLSRFTDVTLGSDAFFPFRDNIDRASKSGVKYIAQPGGSIRDDIVIDACNEYQMVMVFTGNRLFHH